MTRTEVEMLKRIGSAGVLRVPLRPSTRQLPRACKSLLEGELVREYDRFSSSSAKALELTPIGRVEYKNRLRCFA